ncbi:MAG: pitrilysin family protein [Actinomycetia bacterium]|nr:pitrilysin family protein [Actinomycetes bacterium]
MGAHESTTLENGMRVVSEHIEAVRSVAIGFWVGVGSRDERASQAGASHLLEHLLFKGTTSYTAQDIAEIFDGLGGELNAATTRELTVVHARVLDDHLETAFDVMSDMVHSPTISDLASEREVVLEEIAMVEDAPQESIHDLSSQAIFGDHPLGRPVIGNAEVVSTVSRRALGAYHRARYVPPNLVVAAAGHVDHDRLVRLVEQASRAKVKLSARKAAARRPVRSLPSATAAFQPKDTEQYHVCVGAPGVCRSDPRRFAAAVLDNVLGGTASSRLFQEIREKRGLAYSVYTFGTHYEDTGEIGVYVGTRAENLGRCLELVGREFGAVRQGELGEAELVRAKEHLKGRIMLSLESTVARMNRLGRAVIAETELLSFDEVLAQIDAVSGDDVVALGSELFAPARLSVAGIGPRGGDFRRAVCAVNPLLGEEAV